MAPQIKFRFWKYFFRWKIQKGLNFYDSHWYFGVSFVGCLWIINKKQKLKFDISMQRQPVLTGGVWSIQLKCVTYQGKMCNCKQFSINTSKVSNLICVHAKNIVFIDLDFLLKKKWKIFKSLMNKLCKK